jgi:hypothetical protein
MSARQYFFTVPISTGFFGFTVFEMPFVQYFRHADTHRPSSNPDANPTFPVGLHEPKDNRSRRDLPDWIGWGCPIAGRNASRELALAAPQHSTFTDRSKFNRRDPDSASSFSSAA